MMDDVVMDGWVWVGLGLYIFYIPCHDFVFFHRDFISRFLLRFLTLLILQ